MNMTKRITALLLALVMALSLSTMAFADGTTTTTTGKVTRTTVNSIDAVSSVTIGGTTAYYEKDSNTGDQIYIRAMVAGGTENGLKSTNVVINLSNAGATINGDLSFTGAGNVRTATNVNLLNKVYTVIISTSEGGVTTSKTYKLAAGLPSGAVAIDGNDPLRIISIVVGDATNTAISATNVQNPFMGNTKSNKDGKWTFINYNVNASLNTVPASRASVPATLSLPTNTTASGCYNATTNTLDLSTGAPKLILTNGTESRNYYVFATDTNTFKIEYGFDFTEAVNSTAYKNGDLLEDDYTVTDAVDDLIDMAHRYFASADDAANITYGTITVTAGETVMDIMRKFAVANQLGSEVPAGCTYMATLNGVGEFTFGSMSGWMYTDGPDRSEMATNPKFYENWNTPPIGAASYTLSAGDKICWFICCDYTHHPW